MKNIRIAIGSDHAGFVLKESVKKFLESNGYEHNDFGVYQGEKTDYPVIARTVAEKVAEGQFNRGIILCGSGLGVAITANKVKGIRAVTCHDLYSARMSRSHNDANVLTLGGRIIGTDLASEIVDIWLKTSFEGGRHQTRVDMIE